MIRKILGKNGISKQTNGKKKESRVAIGAPAYRRTIASRAAASTKALIRKPSITKTKQSKGNTRERRHGICKQKRTEDTSSSHLWLVNKSERSSTISLALGYRLLDPSRDVRAYHCMPYSSPGVLCSDPFHHELFRPLFRRSATSPLVLGYSRSLVGVEAEKSEVVKETPHPLFFLAPQTARSPH